MFRDSKSVKTRPNLNLGTFYDTKLNSEGEGPSRGLLRDYESSDGPSFQALVAVYLTSRSRVLASIKQRGAGAVSCIHRT